MSPTATLAVSDGVGTITLANPPVNALHPDGEENGGGGGRPHGAGENGRAGSHQEALSAPACAGSKEEKRIL